jgi:Ca-activated chloride channel family protein
MAPRIRPTDKKDGGELGAGHTVTRPLSRWSRSGRRRRWTCGNPWSAPLPGSVAADGTRGDEIALVKLRYKEPAGSESREITLAVSGLTSALDDFRFAAAVAGTEWCCAIHRTREVHAA